jgi:nicotinate-nucleotide pyrophosphorylase (carboxylating)
MPSRRELDRMVRAWLREDLGSAGDITSKAMIPAARAARAVLRARGPGVFAGAEVARRVVAIGAPRVRLGMRCREGDRFRRGDTILTLHGPLRQILAVERTLLNALGRLCGVATATRELVDRVRGTGARIRDTRKTTPGLRLLEKHAVACGGGLRHRVGLHDAFLAKDNHLSGIPAAAVGAAVRRAVQRVRRACRPAFVMVEVDTAAQFQSIMGLPRGVVDVVLLDNMAPAAMRRLVARRDRLAPWLRLEASGGVTPRTVRAIARSGVDFISVGGITHSAPQVDLGLDMVSMA